MLTSKEALNRDDVVKLHHGTKDFWRTAHTLDVSIFEHSLFNVLEVCMYDPAFTKELPRIYLSNLKMVGLLNVSEEVKAAKELALRRHAVPDEIMIRAEEMNKAKVKFILDHISIVKCDVATKEIDVEFNLNGSLFDEYAKDANGKYQFECVKPPTLIPVIVTERSHPPM